jgi:hypothetical protein
MSSQVLKRMLQHHMHNDQDSGAETNDPKETRKAKRRRNAAATGPAAAHVVGVADTEEIQKSRLRQYLYLEQRMTMKAKNTRNKKKKSASEIVLNEHEQRQLTTTQKKKVLAPPAHARSSAAVASVSTMLSSKALQQHPPTYRKHTAAKLRQTQQFQKIAHKLQHYISSKTKASPPNR